MDKVNLENAELHRTDSGKLMDSYTAVGLAEGFVEAESEEQVLEAWQHLINTGQCWTLQGWFGRTATFLIEQGLCSPAPVAS